ncbi:S8 family serine peptidase [Neobacillus niacini]|uniref:S8 family serine peptidase n=1 Tax=Neobacillus niacini TaxID=86668 RepID=UPI0005EF3231|nr:S8 family serine peptidase [Neobacillus niacini]
MQINSFIKKAAALAFSAGLIISPIHSVLSTEAVAQELKTADILSSLTKEQREALNQLQVNKPTGLQGFSEAELQSKEDISVIVEFKANPGKVAVLEAAAKGKTLKIEDAAAKVEKEHITFKEDIKKYLTQGNPKSKNSSNSITQTFKKAYNGVAMTLPADQVKLLLESDVVQAVYKNQTFTVDPIKQDLPTDVDREITTSVESIPYLKIDKLHEEGITGKGVKVAVLDTGIDYNHPDLKDAYKGGYDFVENDNDPMETTYADWQKSGRPERNPFTGSTYYTEHGTHVSGTIAGQNKNNSEVSVEGVAPDAELYVYRVLGAYGSGTGAAILGGIDKAVADGMDVMNLSLGANINDPYFPLSTAINYAVLSGVTAVVAAGNAGPDFYTVGTPGTAALALTVGASDVPVKATSFTGSISGDWSTKLISMGRSYADNLSTLNGQSLELVDVGLGSTYDYEGKDVKGKIAFVQRGEFALVDKIKFAKQHGAAAVIMYNNVDGQIGTNLGESVDFIPTFSITKAAGEELKAKIAQGNTAFTFSNLQDIVTEGDKLAYFSSRGPVEGTLDIKPEVVAPGVSVLSTVPSYITNPTHQEDYKYAYARHDGTSMATPHTAGIAALLLQANPKLDPDDIKTILMNTADPLNGEYSLYEMGAGRVDPYQAIHGGMKMQVTDETFIPDGEDFMKVKNPSGDIMFGFYDRDVTGSNIRVSKNISFTNNSDITKNFTVSVEENVLKNDTNSLSKNGVIVSTSKSITVQANKEVKQNVFLTAPKTAKWGLYEGYIVLTNKADSSDKYRIPFNFYIENNAAYALDLYSHSILPKHLDQDPERRRPNYHYLAYGNLTVIKPLKTLDVTLQDAETGKELGFVGTMPDLEILPPGIEINVSLFTGTYYAFTGDPKQPIAKEKSYAKPGHYKLNITTVTQAGAVKNEAQDVFIDIDDPTFTSSLDGPSPFLEYKPGQQTYPFNIQITDPLVAEMQKAGIDIDQSSNEVIPNWDPKQPLYPISMDKDGKWASVVKLDETVRALRYTLDGFDKAGNLVPTKEYFFVKEGTPVTYAKSDIKKVKTGETIKGQLFLDNVSDAKEVVWNLKDPSGKAILVDAKLANGVSDKATITVNGDEVKVVFNDSNLTFDHTAVVDVTVKVRDEIFTLGASINPTATVINSQNQTSKLLNAGYNFEVLPQFNAVSGRVTPDGFRTSKYSSVLNPTEWIKAGASLKLKDSSGFTFDATPLISVNGDYSVGKLPLSKDPYTLDIKVPGHFEVHTKQPIGFENKGELFGQNLYIYPYLVDLKAGDVNQDNVIDVLDAIEIQKAWQTSNRAADINFDGTVDAKDIGFVKENYLLQNKYAENPPVAKETHDGKTLDSILKELGIQ